MGHLRPKRAGCDLDGGVKVALVNESGGDDQHSSLSRVPRIRRTGSIRAERGAVRLRYLIRTTNEPRIAPGILNALNALTFTLSFTLSLIEKVLYSEMSAT
jgi:hypothetical protein